MAKKQKGPSSFCEWMIGTSVESVMKKSRKTKATKREILRLEIATDDESGEDTVKLTYPRTGSGGGRAPRAPVEEPLPDAVAVAKKVRFEENAPPKSALKKTKKTTVITEVSESEEDDSSEVNTDGSTEANVAEAEAEREESGKPKKKGKKKKQAAKHQSESESDSEPHPDCPCKNCVRERRHLSKANKLKRQQSNGKKDKMSKKTQKEDSSDDESSDEASSDSEVEVSKPKKATNAGKANTTKGNKKANRQKTDPEPSNEKKSKKKADRNANQEATSNNDQAASGEGEKTEESSAVSRGQAGLKKGNYPEAFPDMHARRPNYIAPVRAEVVQTERVIETPHDPIPNAYFDDEHAVLRIYHGPSYGSNANQALYPRRDKPFRPPPMGVTHPLHNPHLGGYNQPQGQLAGEGNNENNIPVTQGMPINAWHAMYPPPKMPMDQYPGQHWPPYMPGMPFPGWLDMTRGPQPPSTHDKDKAGADNVMPPDIKPGADKPVSKAPSQKSCFASFNPPGSQGSRKSAHGSTAGNDQGGVWGESGGQNGNAPSQTNNDWGATNNNNDSTWGTRNNNINNDWGNNNDFGNGGNNSTWGGNNSNNGNTWGTNDAGQNQNDWTNGGSQNGSSSGNNQGWNGDNVGNVWGTENNGSSFGNGNDRATEGQDDNNNEGGAFAGTDGFEKPPSVMAENNIGPMPVMPGSWGDPTAAASTKGQVDATSW